MQEHHTCEAVVVHCIDFRFQKAIAEFLDEKFPGGYDRISLAGGVKDLILNGENSSALQNLQVSSRLHGPKTIILIQHEDCGAYGGSKTLGNVEMETQNEELRKAEEILKRSFSQKIERYIAMRSGKIEQR